MQWRIFLAFFRVGMLGYGGGPASIPLVHKEVVEHYKWMTDEEFGDVLALGNTLPGPIVTKLAGYIGYKKGGALGAVNGVIAIVGPTGVLMIALFAVLANFQDAAWVNGITNGVLPVVTVMMGVLTWSFIQKSTKDLGWVRVLFFIIFGLLIISVLNVHPAIVIVLLIAAALLQKDKKKEGTA